jgi:hypothetical protein
MRRKRSGRLHRIRALLAQLHWGVEDYTRRFPQEVVLILKRVPRDVPWPELRYLLGGTVAQRVCIRGNRLHR